MSVIQILILLTGYVSGAFERPCGGSRSGVITFEPQYQWDEKKILLFKAINGLRRPPLLWLLELRRTVLAIGGQETFEGLDGLTDPVAAFLRRQPCWR